MTIGELLAQFGNKYLVAMLTTWKLTAVSFAFALLIGVAVTVMRTCPVRPLRMLGDFYVQVFRNIPGAALLMVLVYALPYLGAVLPYGNCVVIATTLIPSAFCSEYLMSGINTIGIGLPKDSDGVAFVNAFLKKIEDDGTWAKLWKISIGDRTGITNVPNPPAIAE